RAVCEDSFDRNRFACFDDICVVYPVNPHQARYFPEIESKPDADPPQHVEAATADLTVEGFVGRNRVEREFLEEGESATERDLGADRAGEPNASAFASVRSAGADLDVRRKPSGEQVR